MKILFVCTGNTCRSPMAAALLEDMIRGKGLDIEVRSAGIFAQAGQRASRWTIEALKVDGIDIGDSHRASVVSQALLKEADLVLTMGTSHKRAIISAYRSFEDKVFTLREYAYGLDGDVADPFGGDMDVYVDTKEEIRNILKDIIQRI